MVYIFAIGKVLFADELVADGFEPSAKTLDPVVRRKSPLAVAASLMFLLTPKLESRVAIAS